MTKTATKLGMLAAVAVLAACGKAPATLQELQVQPPVTEVTEHLRAGVAAIAVYSDGTQQDVTAQVEWSSLDAAVATAAAGYIQGGQPGSTYLTASWSGLTSQARVDVVAADLLALTVATDAAARPAGLTAQATASGAFSDGSEADLTGQLTWTSGDQTIALVYSWMDAGTIFARENGTVTIRATDPVSGLSAEYQLEIR